jgi:hypothetical protein
VGGSGRRDRWQGRRTFTGSLTTHVGASLLSAWGLQAHGCVCGVRQREPREIWRGVRRVSGSRCMQQGWAAGAQQARAVPRVAGRARTLRRRPGTLGDFESLRTLEFERDDSKRPLSSQTGQVPAARAAVCFPSCPRHSARLLRACCPTLLHAPAARYPAHASPDFPGLPLPHAAHTPVCLQAPCTEQGCSYVRRQRPREGAPPLPPIPPATASHRLANPTLVLAHALRH